jgi:hypothetical protein
MNERHKLAIHRRGFLNGLIGGLAGGSLIATTESLVTGASAGTQTNDEKRKSRYRVTDEVKTYYRVNSYPT